jgi:hypothetical protein
MIYGLKKGIFVINSRNNPDARSGMNRGIPVPQYIKIPASSGSLQRISIGQNPLRMEPPISPLSMDKFQSRLFESNSLRNRLSNIELSPPPPRTPFMALSPDRFSSGILNAVLDGSRIKSRGLSPSIKALIDRPFTDWAFKEWFLPINLHNNLFRFVLCLSAGFTVWSVYVLNTVVVFPKGGFVDPLWLNEDVVNMVREYHFHNILYSNMVPGDTCVYPDQQDIRLQEFHNRVVSIVEENQRIFGLEFNPLDINRAKAVEKMLLGFFFVSLTLGFMACRAFDN